MELIVIILFGISLAKTDRSVTLDVDNVTKWVLKEPITVKGDLFGVRYKTRSGVLVEKVIADGQVLWESSETEKDVKEIDRYQSDVYDLLWIKGSFRGVVCYAKNGNKWNSMDKRECYLKLLSLNVKSHKENVLDISNPNEGVFFKSFRLDEPKFVQYVPLDGHFCTMVVDNDLVIWQSDSRNTLVDARVFKRDRLFYLDIRISDLRLETSIYYRKLYGKWIPVDVDLYKRTAEAVTRFSRAPIPVAKTTHRPIKFDVVKDLYKEKATSTVHDYAFFQAIIFYPREGTSIVQVWDNGTRVWRARHGEECIKIISVPVRVIPYVIYILAKMNDEEVSYFYYKKRDVWTRINRQEFEKIRRDELEKRQYIVLDISSYDPSTAIPSPNQGHSKDPDPSLFYPSLLLSKGDVQDDGSEGTEDESDQDEVDAPSDQGDDQSSQNDESDQDGSEGGQEDDQNDEDSDDDHYEDPPEERKYDLLGMDGKNVFYMGPKYPVNKVVDGDSLIWESGIENSVCHFIEMVPNEVIHAVIEDANSVTNIYFAMMDGKWTQVPSLPFTHSKYTGTVRYPDRVYKPRAYTRVLPAPMKSLESDAQAPKRTPLENEESKSTNVESKHHEQPPEHYAQSPEQHGQSKSTNAQSPEQHEESKSTNVEPKHHGQPQGHVKKLSLYRRIVETFWSSDFRVASVVGLLLMPFWVL